jgi:oxalate decarboxylase/phosphoglucose isomerase-like protein (cupin superfamily)
MTLRFIRSLEEMRPVLKDQLASGPDPVYTVYENLDNGWANKTIITPGTYNGEFSKTFGHYHADQKDEIYHIESGQGLLLLQSDTEFLLIRTKPGDDVTIPKEYAHCWVNIGPTPLISYDNHFNPQDDYHLMTQNHGLAYYIMSDAGQPLAVLNPNYANHPQLKWKTT